MDRDVFGLGHQPSGGIADPRRKIAARIEDLGVGCPQHRLAHLLDDGMEPVLNHGHGNRIEMSPHGVIVMELESAALLRRGRIDDATLDKQLDGINAETIALITEVDAATRALSAGDQQAQLTQPRRCSKPSGESSTSQSHTQPA